MSIDRMSARITEAMRDASANILAQADGCQYVFAKHYDLADMVLAAALSTEAEEWQPIETAPKDGSRIQLLATKLGRMKLLPDILWIKVGSWRKHHEDGYEFAWREDAVAAPVNTGRARLAPTHWRMLPAAPLPEDTHHGR